MGGERHFPRMYYFYRLLTAASMLFLVPYYALRGLRRGDSWRGLRERLGILTPQITACVLRRGESTGSQAGAIWLHAVSVGEVLAAAPLAARLKEQYSDRPVLVSTTTETGQALARQRLPCADGIFYFPLDWAVAVRRALQAIRPALVIVMETEIWPNFLSEARRRSIPVIFANARISQRSITRYRRWSFVVRGLFQRILRNAELFLAQAPEDAARLIEMGAPEERVEVTGNLKYDGAPPEAGPFGQWLEEQINRQERWPVLIAGSVVAEEEGPVLAAYDIVQRRWRRALLVLAPRKPDRFDAAASIGAAGGWNVVRRSRLDLSAPLDEQADVLVLDSIGELAGLYRLADAVFVGGSLVPAGGHNILEPAWFSRPPVFGPSMENFRDMAAQFLSARAGMQVRNGFQLGQVWVELIEDDALRERMGRSALELSQRNRGATARSLARIAALLDSRGGAA